MPKLKIEYRKWNNLKGQHLYFLNSVMCFDLFIKNCILIFQFRCFYNVTFKFYEGKFKTEDDHQLRIDLHLASLENIYEHSRYWDSTYWSPGDKRDYTDSKVTFPLL